VIEKMVKCERCEKKMAVGERRRRYMTFNPKARKNLAFTIWIGKLICYECMNELSKMAEEL